MGFYKCVSERSIILDLAVFACQCLALYLGGALAGRHGGRVCLPRPSDLHRISLSVEKKVFLFALLLFSP